MARDVKLDFWQFVFVLLIEGWRSSLLMVSPTRHAEAYH